ncbi:MAG: hypothetical protein KME63_09440 [Candidatus Thiodiazotropha sp. (ex Clathrolucina costata)]|nr:hypothetical protein [Candidatus Thiodiazotropha taylori]MCG7864298.1 hypothetical protein [Candidatus Thiodiazotropha endolucinida]
MRFLFLCKTACLLLLFPVVAQALAFNAGNNWPGIFAGTVTPYKITVKGELNSYALLTWKLTLKGRTLSKGRQEIRFLNSETVTTKLPLQVPPLKPGVKLEADLIVALAKENPKGHKVQQRSKLMIYPPDVLQSEQSFYRRLNIQLFDPKGTTAKIFDALKIPYTTLSITQLTRPRDKGLVVVGSGFAFKTQQGLLDLLSERAGEGQQILLLQPVSGAFSVSGLSTGAKNPPSSISFADSAIVPSFAKDLHWISDTSIKTPGLSLYARHQKVMLKVVDSTQDSWDWVDISYRLSGGRLIVCMLPFDRLIYQGPVPQLILGNLLAYTSGQTQSE